MVLVPGVLITLLVGFFIGSGVDLGTFGGLNVGGLRDATELRAGSVARAAGAFVLELVSVSRDGLATLWVVATVAVGAVSSGSWRGSVCVRHPDRAGRRGGSMAVVNRRGQQPAGAGQPRDGLLVGLILTCAAGRRRAHRRRTRCTYSPAGPRTPTSCVGGHPAAVLALFTIATPTAARPASRSAASSGWRGPRRTRAPRTSEPGWPARCTTRWPRRCTASRWAPPHPGLGRPRRRRAVARAREREQAATAVIALVRSAGRPAHPGCELLQRGCGAGRRGVEQHDRRRRVRGVGAVEVTDGRSATSWSARRARRSKRPAARRSVHGPGHARGGGR